jgi:hypothetical protein
MENTTKDSVSTRSPASRSASSEKEDRHPIAPNTAHDNWLGDFYNPVFDGPEKRPMAKNLNTEGDE